MSNQGLLLAPGTVNDPANRNHSGAVVISVNGGSLLTHGPVTIGGQGTIAGMPIASAVAMITPSDYGLISFNYPFFYASGVGSAVTTGGKLYLAQVTLPGNTPVTNLWFSIATAAATPTTGQNFAGIYTQTGNLVASTADLSATIGTNTGAIKCPLSSAYTTPATYNGMYFIGLLLNAATLPVLNCYVNFVTVTSSVASFGSSATFGNTAANYPFALAASSTNTALPNPVTMSTNTATGAYTFWVGAN